MKESHLKLLEGKRIKKCTQEFVFLDEKRYDEILLEYMNIGDFCLEIGNPFTIEGVKELENTEGLIVEKTEELKDEIVIHISTGIKVRIAMKQGSYNSIVLRLYGPDNFFVLWNWKYTMQWPENEKHIDSLQVNNCYKP